MRERWFVLKYSLRRQEQTSGQRGRTEPVVLMYLYCDNIVDDDVYYYMCWRLKLEGESENMGVCTKERKGVAAEGLLATPCTNSLAREGDVDSKNGTHSS